MKSLFTADVERYLEQVLIPLRLSFLTPSNWPMVISLWFNYQMGHLHCATSGQAKVVKHLRHNPRCAYEVASDQPPYCGVRGRGLATIDQSRGESTLKRLLTRYLGGTESPLAQTLLARSEHEVALVIQPVSAYVWNFTRRMRESIPPSQSAPPKLCPGTGRKP